MLDVQESVNFLVDSITELLFCDRASVFVHDITTDPALQTFLCLYYCVVPS